MLRVSKLADYATAMVQLFAQHAGTALTAVEVAEKTSISLPTVRKLLKQLSQQHILRSTRGALGGYQLLKEPIEISLAQVVEAIDGPLAITACTDPNQGCIKSSRCDVKENWQVINGVVKQALASVNFAQMLGQLRPQPVLPVIISSTGGAHEQRI